MINRTNERVRAAIVDPYPTQIFHRFFFAKIDKLALDLRADNHGFSPEVMPRIISHKIDMSRSRLVVAGVADPGTATGDSSEIRFRNVAGENHWLGGQQKEIARDRLFFRRQLSCDRRLSRIEMRE